MLSVQHCATCAIGCQLFSKLNDWCYANDDWHHQAHRKPIRNFLVDEWTRIQGGCKLGWWIVGCVDLYLMCLNHCRREDCVIIVVVNFEKYKESLSRTPYYAYDLYSS